MILPFWYQLTQVVLEKRPLIGLVLSVSLISAVIVVFLQEKMMETFDRGHRKRFFDLWLENFRDTVHDDDTAVEHLEFYLNVHFAIYARKHGIYVSCNYYVTVLYEVLCKKWCVAWKWHLACREKGWDGTLAGMDESDQLDV